MAQLKDTIINGNLTISGGGSIDDDPTSDTDIVNKKYVDTTLSSGIKFRTISYGYPGNFDSPIDAFKDVAESVPSDGCTYYVNFHYGSYYNAIVQSYTADTYRSIFVTAYSGARFPVYLTKRSGVWDPSPDNNRTATSSVTFGNIGIGFGTKIVSGQGASKTSALVTTLSDINSLFSTTGSSASNTVVFASNGDGNHSSVHIEGCTLQNSSWLATFNTALSNTIRLNYMIVRWNLT